MTKLYQIGVTGLHTIDQLKRQVQVLLEQPDLNAATTQNALLMELLLHIYDKLDSIDESINNLDTGD